MSPAGGGAYDIEYRTLGDDGILRWIHASGRVIFDTIEGTRRPVRFVGTIADVSERIVTAHVAYTKETPEFIAEYATVRHEQAGSATTSRAYYVQTGYRFGFDARKWKAFYRFEHIGIPSSDPVFSTIPLLDQSTLGLRYDVSSFAAIKGEFRTWTRGPGTVRDRGGYFQVAFTF